MGALAEKHADEISNDFVWRRRELDVARMLARNSKNNARRTARKSCIILNYAHWEGFAKFAFTKVVDSISEHLDRKICKFDDLTDRLRAMSIWCEYKSRVGGESDIYCFSDAVSVLLQSRQYVRIRSDQIVETRSNLNTDNLLAMLFAIGVDSSRYKIKEFKIDERICGFRHQLAHGNHQFFDSSIDDALFEDTIDEGLGLMTELKDDLMNFLVLGEFQKHKIQAPTLQ